MAGVVSSTPQCPVCRVEIIGITQASEESIAEQFPNRNTLLPLVSTYATILRGLRDEAATAGMRN